MHVVRENIHGTAPGSLTFKEGRINQNQIDVLQCQSQADFLREQKSLSFTYLQVAMHISF